LLQRLAVILVEVVESAPDKSNPLQEAITLKVTAPNDLEGRLLACVERSTLIAETLENFSCTDAITPSTESYHALSLIAEELSDEIEAVRDAYVTESNTRFVKEAEAGGKYADIAPQLRELINPPEKRGAR
jgi:hypothetical protein